MSFEYIKMQMANAYSQKAGEYGRVRSAAFDAFLHREMGVFASSVKPLGNKVLDVGSGPGNDSVLLRQQNLSPVCIDFGYGMALECLRKNLETCVADFYQLCFGDQTFSGVWMAFSFLHVAKSDAPIVLREIHRVMRPKGILYLSLFEGTGEGLREEDIGKYGCKRYFAYYNQDELGSLVTAQFAIIKTARLDISPRPTISIQCERC
jgi:ubiquinone/menaquinone biosynthesis C-methylase UbiE